MLTPGFTPDFPPLFHCGIPVEWASDFHFSTHPFRGSGSGKRPVRKLESPIANPLVVHDTQLPDTLARLRHVGRRIASMEAVAKCNGLWRLNLAVEPSNPAQFREVRKVHSIPEKWAKESFFNRVFACG